MDDVFPDRFELLVVTAIEARIDRMFA